MTIGEVMERERVARILRQLEEAHNDPAYRTAVLADLFERGPGGSSPPTTTSTDLRTLTSNRRWKS
jgi:hypothetical protein